MFWNKLAKFDFPEKQRAKCLVCKHVADGSQIMKVYHRPDEPKWRFVCGKEEHLDEDFVSWRLKKVVQLDDSVNGAATIDEGFYAKRKFNNPKWSTYVIRYEFSHPEERLEYFTDLMYDGDFNEVDGARDLVKPEDLETLVYLYSEEEDWNSKRRVVEMVQDHNDAQLDGIMLDYLRAPNPSDDEDIELAKAVAIGYYSESYKQFTKYYKDRALLRKDVSAVLAKEGLELEEGVLEQMAEVELEPNQVYTGGNTPEDLLYEGIFENDTNKVQEALKKGAEVNAMIDHHIFYGCSPLMVALHKGLYGVSKIIVDAGADVNYKRKDQYRETPGKGQNPLQLAVDYDDIPFLNKLVNLGADVNARDSFDATPLHAASSCGNLPTVERLVELGADVKARDDMGRTAYNYAAKHGRTSVMKFFLDIGLHPDTGGDVGYSPLMLAAMEGDLDTIKLMIEAGANVNARFPKHEYSAVYEGYTPLAFAVETGKVGCVKALVNAGANVNYTIPAVVNHYGEDFAPRKLTELAKGKRSESIIKVLDNNSVSETHLSPQQTSPHHRII